MSAPTPGSVLPVRIAGTAALTPGPRVTTAELVARMGGVPDAAQAEARTGIAARHFAPQEQSFAELGAEALRAALTRAGLEAERLERLIFVTSVGGDVLIPANANLVAAALGLRGTCGCFDLNNACMGFLTAFDVAARGIATGLGPAAIVVVELLSRYTTPDDPRPYLVVADAVAAVVLDRARDGEGVVGAWLRNDGTVGGDVSLMHPGLTGHRETIRFAGANRRIRTLAIDATRASVDAVLAQAGLTLAEVDWILPHQPNGVLLAAMIDALGFDPARVTPVVHEVGSVGAASIPTSLDRLLRGGRVRAGDRLLLVGVGAGVSTGAILLRTGTP